MYQYKAILSSTREVIAQEHTIEDLENAVLHYRRGQKKGEHTLGNVKVEVYHIENDHDGRIKEKLIKSI